MRSWLNVLVSKAEYYAIPAADLPPVREQERRIDGYKEELDRISGENIVLKKLIKEKMSPVDESEVKDVL